jgi:hypothetical protein
VPLGVDRRQWSKQKREQNRLERGEIGGRPDLQLEGPEHQIECEALRESDDESPHGDSGQ